jgi:glycosyltransferase involved in cell wall biosynthesis
VKEPGGIDVTCLLPVYGGDEAAAFTAALTSVADAPSRPGEIFICVDGELGEELGAAVQAGAALAGARLVANPGPRGLHHNLNHAAERVRTPWIARMDADDVSLPDRFLRQMRRLGEDPRIDVLGGAIREWAPGGAARRRIVPTTAAAILRWSLWRSPMNHQTVIMRTDLFRACGGYPDIPGKEDYGLWLKMLAAGGRLANLPEDLVDASLGEGFYGRRTGLKNLKSEWALWRLKRNVPGMSASASALAMIARAAALSASGPARLIYEHLLR